MIVTHRYPVTARCPVDEDVIDVYDTTFTTDRIINVELILDKVRDVSRLVLYQEDVTRHLADAIGCKVTTTGTHSGVATTVTVEP